MPGSWKLNPKLADEAERTDELLAALISKAERARDAVRPPQGEGNPAPTLAENLFADGHLNDEGATAYFGSRAEFTEGQPRTANTTVAAFVYYGTHGSDGNRYLDVGADHLEADGATRRPATGA